jgi:hypothetical protein
MRPTSATRSGETSERGAVPRSTAQIEVAMVDFLSG